MRGRRRRPRPPWARCESCGNLFPQVSPWSYLCALCFELSAEAYEELARAETRDAELRTDVGGE